MNMIDTVCFWVSRDFLSEEYELGIDWLIENEDVRRNHRTSSDPFDFLKHVKLGAKIKYKSNVIQVSHI
jgi:hypothetical protein